MKGIKMKALKNLKKFSTVTNTVKIITKIHSIIEELVDLGKISIQ